MTSALLPRLRTAVGKKFLISITGLIFSGFVLSHMAGNMLLFVSAEAYNKYSHALVSNPLIYFAEAVLVVALFTHMALALSLALENRKARGTMPHRPTSGQKATNLGSRWMAQTGLLIFVFLVLHLKTFKYGTHYEATYAGQTIRDIYRVVFEKFQDPLYVVWYEFSLVILFIHLRHGISSCLQSLGIASSRNPKLQLAGWIFAGLVAGGFAVQPLYLMSLGGQP
jgi:succinate dehydrogenase / fumarate reductase, cytochrome b subunit